MAARHRIAWSRVALAFVLPWSGACSDGGERDAAAPDATVPDSGPECGAAGTDGPGQLLACITGSCALNDPRCAPQLAGTVGGGTSLNQPGSAVAVRGGFVDGARLVVTLGNIFDTPTTPFQGAVFAIDLATGDRRVVSGFVVAGDAGAQRVGTGPDFGSASDVQPSGGSWYVLSRLGTADTGFQLLVTQVDPATGNRTRRIDLSRSDSCYYLGNSLAAGPDGTLYSTFSGEGRAGVVSIDLTAARCVPVSASGPSGVGAGPPFGVPTAVSYGLGALWVNDAATWSLVRVDPATGARTRVTSLSPVDGGVPPGSGATAMGLAALAPGDHVVWTGGPLAGRDVTAEMPPLVSVDIRDGARRRYGPTVGPQLVSHQRPWLWTHPSRPLVLVGQGPAVILFDPATSFTNYLSY